MRSNLCARPEHSNFTCKSTTCASIRQSSCAVCFQVWAASCERASPLTWRTCTRLYCLTDALPPMPSFSPCQNTQVDVDMADSSRSPLTINQQLLMMGSPLHGPTTSAAAAAAGAAAIMAPYPGAAAAAVGAGGLAEGDALHQQQQQQQMTTAFPGSILLFGQQSQQRQPGAG
jgi:hypothetical protein